MPECWHESRPMQYVVTITRIIGPTIEEHVFHDLTEANRQFDQLVETTPYERVIIFFFERSSSGGETLIDMHLKEGVNYKTPGVNPGRKP